jgi:hypothetical protein
MDSTEPKEGQKEHFARSRSNSGNRLSALVDSNESKEGRKEGLYGARLSTPSRPGSGRGLEEALKDGPRDGPYGPQRRLSNPIRDGLSSSSRKKRLIGSKSPSSQLPGSPG